MKLKQILFFALIYLVSTRSSVSWDGNRFTEDQPFFGKVVAVQSHWSGYNVLIENIEKDGDYLVAYIWINEPVRYTQIDAKQRMVFLESAIQIEPNVEVERFSWCMGPHLLGKQFGENDLIAKSIKSKTPKQSSHTTPASAPR